MSNIKRKLGQFYTTNYEYILQGLTIPEYIENIIEPFAGNGDLVMFIEGQTKKYNVICYDIDPKKDFIIERDTLNNPPDYNDKFIITNPPYLARNKSENKEIYDKYDTNDLYKCLIKELINNRCLGGILIIPLNFWSSIRHSDICLRKMFLDVYEIKLLNIFEEKVFSDTTSTICSFNFVLKNTQFTNEINVIIYPTSTKIKVVLNEKNNFMIGGEIYNLKLKNYYKITRLTSKNKDACSTNILVKCIDDNEENMIKLSYDETGYMDLTPNLSARTYATLIIEPKIDEEQQHKLIEKFNNYLQEERRKYCSLFLTNYRESKGDFARKRISFDLIYNIVEHILENFDDV